MLETVEMRWFFGEVPLDADLHFSGHTEVQGRTDWYSVPCNPLCGIKVREGKLETKMRVATLGLRDLPPLKGHLEAWRKWSLEFPADDNPTEAELEAVDWLAVSKRRRLKRFDVDEAGVHPASVRPANGCEFEMTELSVNGQTHWTVGFEAVGPRERLEHSLRQVVQHVIQQGGLLVRFDEAHSFGYAEWLRRIGGQSTDG